MTGTRWLVSGRVQGVGFRWFVLQAALDLGLAGTVRNLPDGQVEVVAGGSEEALSRLQTQLRRGPPGARVTAVRTEPVALPANTRGFRVAH